MPVAKFEADFTQFKTAVDGAVSSLKGLEESAQTTSAGITATLTGQELRRFASEATAAATVFVSAFAEEEAAVKTLSVALGDQGTSDVMKQYKDLATQFQSTTVYSDDLIISMEALLVQVGDVAPDQMKQALTAAADLSAGLGISLEAATMLVAKAFATGGTELGKLKTILGDTVPKGASMAQVLQAINDKFGGQASAQVETFSGKMKLLNNQMGDFKEKVGAIIVDGLTPLLNAFTALPDIVQTVIVGVVAIGVALAPLAVTVAALVPLITGLATALGATALGGALAALVPYPGPAGIIVAGIGAWYAVFKNLDVFIWAAKTAWDALTGAVKSAADSIVGYAKAMYDGIKLWLVDRFQQIVEWVNQKIAAIVAAFAGMYQVVTGGSIVPDMVRDIADEFRKLDAVMVEPTMQATRQVTNEFANIGAPVLAPASSSGGGASVVVNMDGVLLSNDPSSRAQLMDMINQSIMATLRGQGVRMGTA